MSVGCPYKDIRMSVRGPTNDHTMSHGCWQDIRRISYEISARTLGYPAEIILILTIVTTFTERRTISNFMGETASTVHRLLLLLPPMSLLLVGVGSFSAIFRVSLYFVSLLIWPIRPYLRSTLYCIDCFVAFQCLNWFVRKFFRLAEPDDFFRGHVFFSQEAILQLRIIYAAHHSVFCKAILASTECRVSAEFFYVCQ